MLKKYILFIILILIIFSFYGCKSSNSIDPEIFVQTNDYNGLIENTKQDITIKQKFTEEIVFGGGSASESWFIDKKDNKLYHIHDYYFVNTNEHNYTIHFTDISDTEIDIVENYIKNDTEIIDKNNINVFYIIENNKKNVQISEEETALTDILFFYNIV